MKKFEISRRTFIRGTGVAIGLPFLEAMLPFAAKANAQGLMMPLRMVFIYKPNGEHQGSWNAVNGQFPYVLQPFNSLKNDITIIQGMRNNLSEPYDDGHAPRLSTFLTAGPLNASTSNVSNSKSADQIVAEAKGTKSLVIAGPGSYGTDNGFNGEYFSSLSWTGPRAAPKIKKPSELFDQIFAGTTAPNPSASLAAARRANRKSILDFAIDEANRTVASLGQSDRQKMDEYLTGVREIEKNIGALESQVQACQADTGRPGDNNTFQLHTQLMFDLLAKALQCGHTQVAAYLTDPEVSNSPNSHHSNSHWTESAGNLQRYLDTNRWYAGQVAAFLQKLKNTQEANGSLLYNSMVLYGNGLGDGDSHTSRNLPLILAGQAQGKLKPGRYVQKPNQPHTNLLLTMMNHMGVSRASFGDSTGVLTDL